MHRILEATDDAAGEQILFTEVSRQQPEPVDRQFHVEAGAWPRRAAPPPVRRVGVAKAHQQALTPFRRRDATVLKLHTTARSLRSCHLNREERVPVDSVGAQQILYRRREIAIPAVRRRRRRVEIDCTSVNRWRV